MSTPLSTGVREDVVSRPDDETITGEPKVAHIVKADGDAAAKVVEARICGSPLEALCGMVFVPQRDPRLSMCAACRDIYEAYRVFNYGLPDNPSRERRAWSRTMAEATMSSSMWNRVWL